jgi:branched-chain amino acid transport system permease protein
MVARHLLSDINPQYWQFWLGLLLVVIVLFARDGVMGGLRRVGAWLVKKSQARQNRTDSVRSAQ